MKSKKLKFIYLTLKNIYFLQLSEKKNLKNVCDFAKAEDYRTSRKKRKKIIRGKYFFEKIYIPAL